MPKNLPVYRIPDFTSARALSQGFYSVDLQTHRKAHAFIQAPHKHDFYLLLHIRQGSGTHTIDFTTYSIKPASFFVLTPGQVHCWDLSPETEGTLLFFTKEFITNGVSNTQLLQYPLFRAWQYPPVLYSTAAELAPAEKLMQDLQQEYHLSLPLQTDALRAYLSLLLIQLSRLYPASPSPSSGHSWPFQLHQLENLVEEHYREHQSVTFYAEALHLSAKYLNELCKQHLGKTTSDLLQERLVLEAKRLLTHSPHLNVAQIALVLGFDDNSYFSRFFKKKEGLSPEQFRQKR